MAKSNPLISVVIVNWNGKKWLPKCLDSLKKQTYKPLEVVVVDNSSTDGSTNLLHANYPWVQLVQSKKNLGFAGGNNLGITKAKGGLILLLNSDTWLDPDFVEKLHEQYVQGKYDVIGPYESNYDNTSHPKNISTIDLLGHTVVFPARAKNMHKLFYKSGVCLLFSKNLYTETGGLDDDFFMYVEEVDWFWRLHLLGKKIGLAENLFVHHAGAGSTGTGLKYNTFLWRNQNTLQMLLKNYSAVSLIGVLPLYLIQNVAEMFAFLLIGKFKIASTYWKGIGFNIRHLTRTLKKRNAIQQTRIVSDGQLMSRMYFGNGKLRHLLFFFEKPRNAVLEIGCGHGFRGSVLSKKCKYVGIDISSENIHTAKARYPHVHFEQGNGEHMRFADNSFDSVYAIEVLEHVDSLENVLHEVKRVLKSGGKFIISFPVQKSEEWLLKLRPTYFKEIHHVRIIDPVHFNSRMHKLGFVKQVEKHTGFLSHIELYVLFTRRQKSAVQTSIGSWRDTPFTFLLHIMLLYLEPDVLHTPLKFIPIWFITIPLGTILNGIGNTFFPKSVHLEYQLRKGL
jgi:GT2 family glycosyltransferase/protein-L-isoaspartate O-methyltransferase